MALEDAKKNTQCFVAVVKNYERKEEEEKKKKKEKEGGKKRSGRSIAVSYTHLTLPTNIAV